MSKSLYSRIFDWTDFTYHCGERMAVCPNEDCETPICVFCEDSCSGCGEVLF